MALREVQIFSGGLQIAMAEQKLDGAQIGSPFQQMRGPAMAQRMRCDPLANAGTPRRFVARDPDGLVGNGLLDVVAGSRGEQPCSRLEPAPVSTQRLQQRRAQRKIAILAALALDHADDHPLAVDVAQLQMGHFERRMPVP